MKNLLTFLLGGAAVVAASSMAKKKSSKMASGGGVDWEKKFKAGDVLKINGMDGFKTIILSKRGYYVYNSDRNGNPIVSPNWRAIMHSNSFLGEVPVKVGHINLKLVQKNIGGINYSYYLSGNDTIDVEMANLDARIEAFVQNATKSMNKKYDDNENDNYHYENAKMVTKWFNNQ